MTEHIKVDKSAKEIDIYKADKKSINKVKRRKWIEGLYWIRKE